MLKCAALASAVIVFCLTPAFAQSPGESPVTPYLGLSMPYPESVPRLSLSLQKALAKSRSIMTHFAVDKKGKIKKVEYPDDSAAFVEPLLKDLKKIKFLFTEGRNLDFPLTVPVEIIYSALDRKTAAADLNFPLSPEVISDPELLAAFFELNDCTPPEIAELKPVFYRVGDPRQSTDYLTVTARVFLDETGELQDITYPLPGQSANNHQVQMAIMNARFRPAIIKSEPVPCDFLLTFRIFTNLEYPFSPLSPPDSTENRPFTAGYFVISYFNAADIGTPALPRTHGAGQIQAAGLGLGQAGIAELFIRIDTVGNVGRTLVLSATPGLADRAEQAIKLVKWYPATDREGACRSFAGKIRLTFDGSTRIVYIPEWLKP